MQIQVVNRRAQERYGQFVSAMDLVLEALESVDKVIARVDDSFRPGGFTVATQAELVDYRRDAFEELDELRAMARKYEAELLSREWRL